MKNIGDNESAVDTLAFYNGELKKALNQIINSINNSESLVNQVNNIKKTLNLNVFDLTFTSLVEQYVKMKQSIDELEQEDIDRDFDKLKSLMHKCKNMNLSSNQAEKISEVLIEISHNQPPHAMMAILANTVACFADDLSEVRQNSDVVVSKNQRSNEDSEIIASDVYLASKRLIKELIAISKQLIQTYPNDKFISDTLYTAKKMQAGKSTFFKSVDLFERSAKHLTLLIQQERCSAEEMLNDIHANIVEVFKESSIVDKLLTTTNESASKLQLSMLAELNNMEIKSKSINSLEGIKKHINRSVLLMSDIMNDYALTQNKLQKSSEKTINRLKSKVSNTTKFIEKLEQRLNTVESSSLIDELTTVGNRKGYVATINKERKSWLASKKPLALMLIDVDKFKNVNDNFGHSVGDQVLKNLGKVLKKSIRSTDYIARYGGEEYIVILPATDITMATKIALKLQKVINNMSFRLRTKDDVLKITCSFGISAFTDKVSSTIDVFNGADKALYQAKENGRNCIFTAMNNRLSRIENEEGIQEDC